MARYAVVKLGGRVLFKERRLDLEYVRGLKEVLKAALALYDGIVTVVGGGDVARNYISWGRELGLSESSLDMVGIRLSRVNASLFWAYFHGVTPPDIPATISEAIALLPAWRLIFLGGLQPAQSTTTVAALVAEALGADRLVIATDVDGVYEEDPKVNPQARKLDEVTVDQLERILVRDVRAGGYALLDSLAVAVIKRGCLDARVVCGKPPSNILAALRGEREGTRIVTT